MQLSDRINLLSALGKRLTSIDERGESTIQRSYLNNKWFTVDNIKLALENIRLAFLQKEKLENWIATYNSEPSSSKKIGLILAGNIPLVGFHDLMCVFLAGHSAQIKLSEKDPYLIPWLLQELTELEPIVKKAFEVVPKLKDFDAVIATGSNNTARYFETYFSKVPNIIRKNRNAIAVLEGDESKDELLKLGEDIFQYFGLGCRNVSKIYVPEGYDFHFFMETMHEFKDIVLHNKYKNNFDYNYTLFILNKIEHFMNGCILVKEDEQIQSRIASLHYEFYSDKKELQENLKSKLEQIQCVVANSPLENLTTVPFGSTQQPSLDDYADGVDTMAFLASL